MGKLFGTDGIRGVANEYPITPEMAVNIGRAVAALFTQDKNGKDAKVIIGKDTRISGDMIEHALVSGICSMGVNAYLTGVLPTPGIAYITASTGASAGIVISASHNPYYDNGIKIFMSDGYKPSEDIETKIENLIFDNNSQSMFTGVRTTGRVYGIEDAEKRYRDFLRDSLHGGQFLKGTKVVLDCANGATYQVAPKLFSELGSTVFPLFIHPDGKNINDHCGSQHPEVLAERVIEVGADIGLAFDGDGDRLIGVDEKGKIASGDQILAICAKFMKKKGLLKNNLLVTTVMSNLGLRVALKEMQINHIMTKVGDRHVMEEMVAHGAVLGGEDSGHMIFLNHHTTGDGILAALRLMEVITQESIPFSELKKVMNVFPQELINVDVTRKPDISNVPEIKTAITAVEDRLGEKGRVLVRYSGTQPICRVMVEGPSLEETRTLCQQIAAVVAQKLN